MKEKDRAHLSRPESDQLPLFQPIFEAKERLLIGRKFLKTKSRPCFFNSGVTTDSFQILGKNPDSSGKFIVVDNIGSNSSRQSFKILVGTGSSKQDFVGTLSTNFLKESMSTRQKAVKNDKQKLSSKTKGSKQKWNNSFLHLLMWIRDPPSVTGCLKANWKMAVTNA